MILNFSWFVLIKRQVSFEESRLKFLLSILTQDLGIIFIGALQDWTHRHHHTLPLVPASAKISPAVNTFLSNHKNQLKRQNINSAFKISFQCMFLVTLVALYCCWMLRQRREIVDVDQEGEDASMVPINHSGFEGDNNKGQEGQVERQKRDREKEQSRDQNTFGDLTKEQIQKVKYQKNDVSQVSVFNETMQKLRIDSKNQYEEIMSILSLEDFNKILLVYVISGISIIFKRNFQRFFYQFSKQIDDDLNFMTMSIIGTCSFMVQIHIDHWLNLKENSKDKLILTILMFMVIQQFGFGFMLFMSGKHAIQVLTIIVFVSSGVIFSTQKRHQMYMSIKNKELLVQSLMVLPSLSQKSFEAILVSELIIHFQRRPNIIWVIFICITTVPIVIIVLYKNWLIADDKNELKINKDEFTADDVIKQKQM